MTECERCHIPTEVTYNEYGVRRKELFRAWLPPDSKRLRPKQHLAEGGRMKDDPQTLDEWRELLKGHPDGIEVEWVDFPTAHGRVLAVGTIFLLGEYSSGGVLHARPENVRPVRPTLTIEISEDDADLWVAPGWKHARYERLRDAIRKAREAQQ